ncbi:hypothetical protein BN14_07076 [Rhizoctonia solani AG-1 IB]|uniref:Uncharacterized protein n=1 Tax=Thanatephorus cucumeris (strain AG1-IB / isolate 7/3/14) TaxID=1108050 RepID=M5C0T9_THACB|nr:hypothetical protein BN14_07076 [Rhizoctonia solani AG-1 IB]
MDAKDKTSFETPEHIDHPASPQKSHDDDAINHWTPDERARAERKLVRKLDCRLMPTMIVIFIMNYIDRTAVTAARLRGLEADLGLSVSNAFGSLMAAGILGGMQGKRGIAAWRWLFFIEGAITIVVGILAVWLLPDYPHNTRWIKGSQRRLAQARLAEDAAEADEDGANDSAFAGLKMALKDPKVPILALMTCSQLLGLSFVNFFPT